MTKKIVRLIGMFLSCIKFIFASVVIKLFNVNNRDTWLLSERGDDACDNAYHLYKYVKENHPEINVKYVISKKSKRLSRIDESDVVPFGSFSHYVLFLSSGKLISTHIMGCSPDMGLFKRLDKKKRINSKAKRVFLQHGITKDDIPMLKYNENHVDVFICGATPEYEFVKENFGYPDGNVKYTGFARYDGLISDGGNTILVMPTFRKELMYNNGFINTTFFKRWSSLLHDDELKYYLKSTGSNLIFCLHPNFKKYTKYFSTEDKRIKIVNSDDVDIQELINSSNLLITDYSSVAFDFAHANKDVIYYQFDYDAYRKKQYNKGYFDYEKDGFGPIVKTEEELIEEILAPRKGNEFSSRAKSFFKYHDRKNCERVFNEIANDGFRKKKIMLVSNSMDTGGIETFLMNILRNFGEKEKYEIVFLTYKDKKFDYEDEILSLGARIVRISSPLKRIKHYQDLKRVMREEKPDAVHSNTYFDCALVMRAAKKANIPVRISHSHTTCPDKFGRGIYHKIMARIMEKNATNLLSCGPEAGYNLFRGAKYELINNGINIEKYKFDEKTRKEVRNELGIKDSDIVIGHVGRLVEVKNHKFLLQILTSLPDGKYKMIFVGEGDLQDELKNKTKELGLSDRVFFLGNRKDTYRIYNAFDMVVFPSIYEGLPMALVEAQANGLPIIASSAVTKDAKLNNNFWFKDLAEGQEKWAKAITENDKKRVAPSEKVGSYSIQNVIKRLKEIYNKG